MVNTDLQTEQQRRAQPMAPGWGLGWRGGGAECCPVRAAGECRKTTPQRAGPEHVADENIRWPEGRETQSNRAELSRRDGAEGGMEKSAHKQTGKKASVFRDLAGLLWHNLLLLLQTPTPPFSDRAWHKAAQARDAHFQLLLQGKERNENELYIFLEGGTSSSFSFSFSCYLRTVESETTYWGVAKIQTRKSLDFWHCTSFM